MTNNELKQSIDELNDAKPEQLTDEEFEALADEMQQEERNAELRECVKVFFDKYLNRIEESSGGRLFNPIIISCCRALMTEGLDELLAKMSELSGAKPKENIYE
jgi:hypothetical protein